MNSNSNPQPPATLKPVSLWRLVLSFGIPAILMAVSVYGLLPYLVAQGFSQYMSLMIASLVPFTSLFFAALLAYRREGNPLTWRAFAQRFRLHGMDRRDWLWTAVLFVFVFVSYLLLNAVVSGLVSQNIIPLPDSVPAIIDPRVQQPIEELAGGPLKGNWPLLAVSLVTLFFNILGEELWWRGYILPRQELSHGRVAWFIHGILWMSFHAFKYWEFIAILPTCLALSFVAQRRKSTWPGIVAHLAVNSLGPIGIALLVLGGGQ